MSDSLKFKNAPKLAAVLVANVVVFYLLIKAGDILSNDWWSVLRDPERVVPAGLAALLVGVLNAQLSPNMKARIVFGRWANPLPGSEAFTRYGPNDPRVDMTVIANAFGPLPTDPGNYTFDVAAR